MYEVNGGGGGGAPLPGGGGPYPPGKGRETRKTEADEYQGAAAGVSFL